MEADSISMMKDDTENITREIISRHEAIVSSMRRSIEEAIKIGELLTQVKKKLKHGQFLPWIEKKLPFAERTAQNYMRLYVYRDKTATLADLQSAYMLIEKLEAQDRTAEQERKGRLIEKKRRTGQKPPGWDRSVDREEKKPEVPETGERPGASQPESKRAPVENDNKRPASLAGKCADSIVEATSHLKAVIELWESIPDAEKGDVERALFAFQQYSEQLRARYAPNVEKKGA